MARTKLGEEEILAQIEAARNRPLPEDQAGPRAIAARYEVEVDPVGDLHWESLDADHHTSFLLRGLFGNERWIREWGRLSPFRRAKLGSVRPHRSHVAGYAGRLRRDLENPQRIRLDHPAGRAAVRQKADHPARGEQLRQALDGHSRAVHHAVPDAKITKDRHVGRDGGRGDVRNVLLVVDREARERRRLAGLQGGLPQVLALGVLEEPHRQLGLRVDDVRGGPAVLGRNRVGEADKVVGLDGGRLAGRSRGSPGPCLG